VNKVDKRQRRRQRLKINWSLIITIFDGLIIKLYQFKTENLCLKKKLIILTKKWLWLRRKEKRVCIYHDDLWVNYGYLLVDLVN